MTELFEVLILGSWTLCASGDKQPNAWLAYTLESGATGFAPPDRWRTDLFAMTETN